MAIKRFFIDREEEEQSILQEMENNFVREENEEKKIKNQNGLDEKVIHEALSKTWYGVKIYGKIQTIHYVSYIMELAYENLMEAVKREVSIPTQQRDWSKWLQYAFQITLGLYQLHHLVQPIIFRNWKAENILIRKNHHMAILGDLRYCKKMSNLKQRQQDEEQCEVNYFGSAYWRAPEVLKENRFSEKSDVYGLGMIFYYMLTCLIPFQDLTMTIEQLSIYVYHGQRPSISWNVRHGCPMGFFSSYS